MPGVGGFRGHWVRHLDRGALVLSIGRNSTVNLRPLHHTLRAQEIERLRRRIGKFIAGMQVLGRIVIELQLAEKSI